MKRSRRMASGCSVEVDKKPLSDGRSIGESAVVCQGQTRQSMLRTGGLRWTKASELLWCGVNARRGKSEIC